MKCKICTRQSKIGSQLCNYHYLASVNLKKQFNAWEHAYGSLLWESYLESISSLSESGEWVREMANYELSTIRQNQHHISCE